MILPSPSCFITFFFLNLWQGPIFVYLLALFYSNLWFTGTVKSTWQYNLDYHLVWSSGRDLVIRLYSKSQIISNVSFFWTVSFLCMYHLILWSNFNFLHCFQWITFTGKLWLVLPYFYASYLQSVIF